MIIVCSKCGKQFESVIVDRKLALEELETLSTKHVQRQHADAFKVVAFASQRCAFALTKLLHFNECVVVPEDENYILEKLEESQDMIMLALGFDPQEDEEEGDGDDDVEEMPLEEEEEDKAPEVIEMVKVKEMKDAN